MIDMNKLKEYAEQNFDDLNIAHTKNVVELALKLAEKENADKEVVEAAAWLHDIGKTLEEGTKNTFVHNNVSIKIAKKLLGEQDVDETVIEKVCKCIKEHIGPWGDLLRGKLAEEGVPEEEAPRPTTKESKCIYDADMIDFCGPFGIAKVIFLRGKKGSKFSETIKERKQLTEDCAADMQTETGKEIIKDYYRVAKEFYKKLNMEE